MVILKSKEICKDYLLCSPPNQYRNRILEYLKLKGIKSTDTNTSASPYTQLGGLKKRYNTIEIATIIATLNA
jgi:hypothetical protein